jgi:hypothetical protein
MALLDGLGWLLLFLGPLLFLQRQLHREIQAVLLLLTRRAEIAMALFSLLFFPGVLLHEGSHFVVARLLGVRTGSFSLIPRVVPHPTGLGGGSARLQLGYVETARADIIRDALIGSAPLVFGGLFVTYAGLSRLGLHLIWNELVATGPSTVLSSLSALYARPDFWLWFYLIFAVSSMMLPSASDRRAWLPLVVILSLLLGVSLLAGAGPWLLGHLAPLLNRAFHALAVVLGISALIHFVLLPPFWALRRLLSRLTGLRVVGT